MKKIFVYFVENEKTKMEIFIHRLDLDEKNYKIKDKRCKRKVVVKLTKDEVTSLLGDADMLWWE